MADHQWFYQRDSLLGTTDNIGPLPERELFTLAKDGKLKRETLVSCQTRTNGAWLQLQHIPAFLKAMDQGENERKEERERQAREKEAERQRKAEERQRQNEVRQVQADRQAEIASRQREVLRQQREQEDAIRSAMFKPREYPAMRVIISLLYFMAILVAASFLLHLIFSIVTFVGALITRDESGAAAVVITAGLFALGISFAIHCIFAISFIAAAESIRVVIDIQHNTQETAFYAKAATQQPRPGSLPLNPIVVPPAVH